MHDSPISSYAEAGVDLDLAQRAKAGLSSAVASTATPLTLDAFGAFGGVIRLPDDISDPALVASIDGVGTKLHLAIEMGRPADAGRDLVNHCLNDVAVQNARPIAFLDYVAADRLDPAVLTSLVQGMASACRYAGVSIVGGETALMPDTYAPGRYDAVGAVIGVASAAHLPDPATVAVGDVCIGLPSSGPHTNGYSLARELFTVYDRETPIGDQTLEDALLAPHLSYLAEFSAAFAVPGTRVAAHITGGGISREPRARPPRLRHRPHRHHVLAPTADLRSHRRRPRCLPRRDVPRIQHGRRRHPRRLARSGYPLARRTPARPPRRNHRRPPPVPRGAHAHAMNLALMASGRGSNAAAILDAIDRDELDARPVALITNRENVGALDVAKAHNVPGYAVPRRAFPSRTAQQRRMLELLQDSGADFVALAGFDAILRPFIIAAYPNRILNIHPSLLPAFAGGMAPRPQTDALHAGVKIAGCTVHVVTEELDAGPIVAQAAVPVLPNDTVDSLSNRILEQEHRVYPLALRWFADGMARVENGRVHIDSEESQALWPHPAP